MTVFAVESALSDDALAKVTCRHEYKRLLFTFITIADCDARAAKTCIQEHIACAW